MSSRVKENLNFVVFVSFHDFSYSIVFKAIISPYYQKGEEKKKKP